MTAETAKPAARLWSKRFTYDDWMENQNVPIHRGYYIADLRTIELGWWDLCQCRAAFIQLTGQEGVTSTRVIEIPPGMSLNVDGFAFDEIAYSLDGHGLTSHVLADGGNRTFEWQPSSMFVMPRQQAYRLSNTDGAKPARLMFFNYLPMAMSVVPDPDFYFRNPLKAGHSEARDFYAEARMVKPNEVGQGAYLGKRVYWYGNFFPSMKAWDKMGDNSHRGAGSTSVYCQFPDTELSAHMSEFASGTYKKAHRHGPGRAIVIPRGEGYSIMWEEGKDKVIIPWAECSLFVPPDRWFHQHFNIGAAPARYLAMHPPMQFHGHAEKVTDRAKDQIEYVDEDPAIRERFETELAKRGLTSRLDPKVYTERDFDWAKFAIEVHGALERSSAMPVADIDGIATRYEVMGSGPPLLMFSPGGFDATIEKWSTLGIYARTKPLDWLTQSYSCILFDRRECGQSGGRIEDVTWGDYAAQGKGLLEHLKIERAHLLGGCMGVSPVTAFAVAYPAMTRSLTLYWPVGGAKYRINGRKRFAEHLDYVAGNGLAAVVALVRECGKPFGGDPRGGPWASVIKHDPDFAARYARFDLETYKRLTLGMMNGLLDRDTAPGAEPEALMACENPALVIPGNDASHATSAARYLAECLPKAEYWDAAVEAQTQEATAERVLTFLAQTG